MAEVLITLGIIGVVAALTIPSLIANNQKKTIMTQLKKVYSTFSQAQLLANKDFEFSDWDTYPSETIENTEEAFNKYLKPYLNIIDICKPNEACFDGKTTSLSGEKSNVYRDSLQIHLQDGTLAYIRYIPTGYFNIVSDVNGTKKPNTMGKDIYNFDLTQKKMDSAACGDCTREKAMTHTIYGCNKRADGSACFRVILVDGWEFKDDYPW